MITTALSYNPSDRFADAETMKEALLGVARKTGALSKIRAQSIAPAGAIKPVWSFKCEDEIRGTPAVSQGMVYVGCYDNNLYALNAADGKFQWKYATDGGVVSRPAVYEGNVFFGSQDRRLHVVSASSGKLAWTYPTNGPIHSSPRIAEGHVFIGSDDHELHAVNIGSSRSAWTFDTGDKVRSTPLVAHELVYVGTESGDLVAVDYRGTLAVAFSGEACHHLLPGCFGSGSILHLHGRNALLPGRARRLGHLAIPAGQGLGLITGDRGALLHRRRRRWFYLLRGCALWKGRLAISRPSTRSAARRWSIAIRFTVAQWMASCIVWSTTAGTSAGNSKRLRPLPVPPRSSTTLSTWARPTIRSTPCSPEEGDHMLDYIRRLLGSGAGTKGERATSRSDSEPPTESVLGGPDIPYEMQQLVAAAGQSIGKQRDHNEDSLLAITTTLAGKSANVPFGLYIVADGMGGHEYGEVASNSALRVVAGQIIRKFHSYLFAIPTQQPDESLQEIMAGAIDQAHRAVQQAAPGSGTTLTAALVLGQQITIGHVGDSRAYMMRPEGHFEQLTEDHSLVRRLEELGHLNKEEAANFPHRNVLIRALGQGDSLDADVFTLPFPRHGTLMLCTDGLWGVLDEPRIRSALSDSPSLQRACHNLVQAANAAGGPDNISVVLVQMIG